ncbi:hypothetical protein BJ165DRAFT_1526444 [Panaeolus papilionaceus]|nr:hypothetical protein BJ165DRAFT_1526444 [Panaeolus papilionaceus]
MRTRSSGDSLEEEDEYEESQQSQNEDDSGEKHGTTRRKRPRPLSSDDEQQPAKQKVKASNKPHKKPQKPKVKEVEFDEASAAGNSKSKDPKPAKSLKLVENCSEQEGPVKVKHDDSEPDGMDNGWDNRISTSKVKKSKQKLSTPRRSVSTASVASSNSGANKKKSHKVEQQSFPFELQGFVVAVKAYIRYLYACGINPFPTKETNLTKHEYVLKSMKTMVNEDKGFMAPYLTLMKPGNETMQLDLVTFAWYSRGYLSNHMINTARYAVPTHFGLCASSTSSAVIKETVAWLLEGHVFTFADANPQEKTYDKGSPFLSEILVIVIRGIWFPSTRTKMDIKAKTHCRKNKMVTSSMILLAAAAIAHILREYSLGMKPITNTDFTEEAAFSFYTGVKIEWGNLETEVPGSTNYIRREVFKRVGAFDILAESQAPIAEVDFEALRSKIKNTTRCDDEESANEWNSEQEGQDVDA